MKKKEKKKKLTAEQITAQEFTNVLNIQNNYLYTRDGYVIGYIKILPVSVGLLSQREKETLVKQLTAELSVEKDHFIFCDITSGRYAASFWNRMLISAMRQVIHIEESYLEKKWKIYLISHLEMKL